MFPWFKSLRVPHLALLGWLGALALLAAGAVLLLQLTSVEELTALEARALSALQAAGPGASNGTSWVVIMRDATALGSAFVLVSLVALVSGYFWLRGRRRGALQLAVTTATGYLLSGALKLAVDRSRPAEVPHLVEVTSASFPSGHSLAAAVVWLTLGAMLARRARGRTEKIYCFAAGVVLTGVVGWSRIMLGVHYPSDVLAGWALGALWAAACWAAFARWNAGSTRRTMHPCPPSTPHPLNSSSPISPITSGARPGIQKAVTTNSGSRRSDASSRVIRRP